MQLDQLKILLSEFGDKVKFEHDLKKKNWFNIGGKANVFYKSDNLKELINFLIDFFPLHQIWKFSHPIRNGSCSHSNYNFFSIHIFF